MWGNWFEDKQKQTQALQHKRGMEEKRFYVHNHELRRRFTSLHAGRDYRQSILSLEESSSKFIIHISASVLQRRHKICVSLFCLFDMNRYQHDQSNYVWCMVITIITINNIIIITTITSILIIIIIVNLIYDPHQ